MELDEAIRHCEEVAEENQAIVDACDYYGDNMAKCDECAKEHRQLATWLEELRVFKSGKGEWLRMSDLSEEEDDRYKCSRCGNVIHYNYKNKEDLYIFHRWCGRCGSDNDRR